MIVVFHMFSEIKCKSSSTFDLYEFDIRSLDYLTFAYIEKYVQRLSNSLGHSCLLVLRCISILIADLHRLLINNNASISSFGMIRKRFLTHTAPTSLQTQCIQVEHVDDIHDDRLDFLTFDLFEIFIRQVLMTMNTIHIFVQEQNHETNNQSMDIDDEFQQLIDRDQIRDLTSRIFFDALDSFFFLLSLFQVKRSQWQKEFNNDSVCFERLIKLMSTILCSSLTSNEHETNDRQRIFGQLSSFTDILNLIDSTRLCQSLELFIQLFDDEQHQVPNAYRCRFDVVNKHVVSIVICLG
jgi:hypothetical protein